MLLWAVSFSSYLFRDHTGLANRSIFLTLSSLRKLKDGRTRGIVGMMPVHVMLKILCVPVQLKASRSHTQQMASIRI